MLLPYKQCREAQNCIQMCHAYKLPVSCHSLSWAYHLVLVFHESAPWLTCTLPHLHNEHKFPRVDFVSIFFYSFIEANTGSCSCSHGWDQDSTCKVMLQHSRKAPLNTYIDLQKLHLSLKCVELSGIAVDHLVAALLDVGPDPSCRPAELMRCWFGWCLSFK